MTRRAMFAQARVERALTLRRGESLLVTLAIPAGVLAFFAKVDVVDTGYKDSVNFLVPGVLALAIMSTAMVSLGIATGFERRYGVLKRLGSTPLGRGELVAAKILTVLMIEMVQVAVLLGIGAALGWSEFARVPAALPIVALGTFAFAGLGLLMAGTLRAELTLALANGVYLALLLLGDMAFPLNRLPGAVEAIASALPAAALASCLRGALIQGGSVPLGALGVLAGWAIFTPLLTVRLFRWEE